jgi:hypothetical protein
MRNYFIIFIFIFLVNCSLNENELGVVRKNISQNEINPSEEYSFEEYVNLLLNKSKSQKYPNINNFPD